MMQPGSRWDDAVELSVDRLVAMVEAEEKKIEEAERLTQDEKRRKYQEAANSDDPQSIPNLIAEIGEAEFLRQANLAVDRMVRQRKEVT